MLKMIKLSDDTHRELSDLGKHRESFDTIVKRLIDFYKKKQGGAVK